MATVIAGSFEWDAAKASSNLVKHGVSFEEAATVLEGDDVLVLGDDENVISIGWSRQARVLLVVSTERGTRTRIISARRATASERRAFQTRMK